MRKLFNEALARVSNEVKEEVDRQFNALSYSPKQKVVIAGIDMFFSHWITHNGKQLPFFHYYINGEEFGYINHSMAYEI